MRRVLRWAFRGLAALSLLLFLVVAVLWVRSRHVLEHIDWGDSTALWELDFDYGLDFQRISPWLEQRRTGWESYVRFDYRHMPILSGWGDDRMACWNYGRGVHFGRFEARVLLNRDGSVYTGPASFDTDTLPQSAPLNDV